MSRTPWCLRDDLVLRPWQAEALDRWKRMGCRGIIEAATGTGKSIVALTAIAHVHSLEGDQLRVALVVPTVALADQWRKVLIRDLSVSPYDIGTIAGTTDRPWNKRHPVAIAVINSARKQLPEAIRLWRDEGRTTLLIVDECHTAGSRENRKIFSERTKYGLGLSATLWRSDGEDHHVINGLGHLITAYGLRDAIRNEDVSQLTSINYYVDFTTTERDHWARVGHELGSSLRSILRDDSWLADMSTSQLYRFLLNLGPKARPELLRLRSLLEERVALMARAEAKLKLRNEILEWTHQSGRRALIFHESIDDSMLSLSLLRQRGARVGLYNSAMKHADRRTELERFKRGEYQLLVAVRALDQGIDVPEANVAVICQGTRTVRQRIQRLGRVIRWQEGKHALCFSVLVRGTVEEALVGARDDRLLGPAFVRHHCWPATPFAATLPEGHGAIPSRTYYPSTEVEESYSIPDWRWVRDLTAFAAGFSKADLSDSWW
jgi:superfamily II DNA or RNA helicase